MPYNFSPLEYQPYSPAVQAPYPQYERPDENYYHHSYPYYIDQMKYDMNRRQSELGGVRRNLADFQDYTGGQLEGLMGSVNTLGESPFVTGDAFYNTPQYTPFGGTREDFTTGGNEFMNPQGVMETAPSSFNQQNYLDAQFGHMNDYLGSLGSYFNMLGTSPAQMSMQNIVANAPGQQAQGPLPTIGGGGGLTYGGGTSTNNPFPSFGLASGGWGTPPTSLFGAGANATNT